MDGGEFPVVLGGDCSIILGPLLAQKRRGRYGLLFIDGHADFYNPEANPNGEAASMDLALATGRGPDILANIEGRGPLVSDETRLCSVTAMQRRSSRTEVSPFPRSCKRSICVGSAVTASHDRTRRRLTPYARTGADGGFWMHVDADVLDDAIMPAVDYRLPDGLSWEELTTVLRIAIASNGVVGLDVTIYNPKLDPDGAGARSGHCHRRCAGVIAGLAYLLYSS